MADNFYLLARAPLFARDQRSTLIFIQAVHPDEPSIPSSFMETMKLGRGGMSRINS
jgi:hypothetical protein